MINWPMSEDSRIERVVDFENMDTSDATRAGRSVEPEVVVAAARCSFWFSGLRCWSCCSSAGPVLVESIVVMGAAPWLENGSNHITAVAVAVAVADCRCGEFGHFCR